MSDEPERVFSGSEDDEISWSRAKLGSTAIEQTGGLGKREALRVNQRERDKTLSYRKGASPTEVLDLGLDKGKYRERYNYRNKDMYPMEKESTNLEQGDRSITGMKVNANLPQELQKKTAEPEMEERHQPDVSNTDETKNPIQDMEKQPERRLRMIQNPERNYRRPKTTLNKNPEKRCNDTTTDQEVPRNPKKRKQQKIDLFETWMEFTYSERIKNGLYDRLPRLGRQRCNCGKSQIGYPHWPPTSFEEATAQFEYRLRDKNVHKKYLTHCWWAFCNNMAAQHPRNETEGQLIYRKQAEEIERRCPSLREELIQEEKPHRRPKGWRCFEYCEPTLRKRNWSCLCFCEHHMGVDESGRTNPKEERATELKTAKWCKNIRADQEGSTGIKDTTSKACENENEYGIEPRNSKRH
ncbi:hypothetical protein V8E54_004531 [Elaphomyces granulatus]